MRVDRVEVGRRLQRFTSAARQAGVRLTHQRLAIFREVASSLEHPSAEAVLRAIEPRLPTVSLDTVYRTLWLLTDLGLISTLGPRRESVRFDANLTHHHHYVCERCGLARDFESDELNGLRLPESITAFGTVVAARVEVRGVCSRCAAAASPKSRPTPPRGGKRRPR